MNGVRWTNSILVRLYRLRRVLHRSMYTAVGYEHLRRMKRCGHGVGIWGDVTITGHNMIVLDANVHIGANAFIKGEGGLTIGANTHISRNLVLYTMNHEYTGKRLPYDETIRAKPVTIGKNVWIGMNVCIAPGAQIGDGAIIGMGTVVSGKVPALAIVVGGAWRQVGTRDPTHYGALNDQGSFAGPSGLAFGNDDNRASDLG